MKGDPTLVVNDVQRIISGLVMQCSETRKRSELKIRLASGFNSLSGSIVDLAAFKRSMVRTRKATEVVLNRVDGLIHGLNTDTITLQEFRSVCADLKETSLPKILAAAKLEVAGFNNSSSNAAAEEAEMLTAIKSAAEKNPELVKALSNSEWTDELLTQLNSAAKAAARNVLNQGQSNADFRKQLQSQIEDSHVSSFIERMKLDGKRLPAKINGGYGITRLPIVPMFENPMAVTGPGLKSIAIRHTSIGGYPVFEDQYILLVSKKEMQSLKPESKKRRVSKTQINAPKARETTVKIHGKTVHLPTDWSRVPDGEVKQGDLIYQTGKWMQSHTADVGLDVSEFPCVIRKGASSKTEALPSNAKLEIRNRPMVEYARSILEILNEHTREHFVLASERFVLNPKNADLLCFWMMPAAKMSALTRITKGTKVRDWSFPFDMKDFNAEVD